MAAKTKTKQFETKPAWVADQLRKAIVSGRLQPGERVWLQEWADRLGVSTTPLREAFKVLEAEGYVTISPHRGAHVASFSPEYFLDLSRTRYALDHLAVELVIERLGNKEREALARKLRERNRQLAVAVESRDMGRADSLNRTFHDSIYQATRSNSLQAAVAPLWKISPPTGDRFYQAILASEAARGRMLEEHDQIAAGIEVGDVALAAAAVRAHMASAIDNILADDLTPLHRSANDAEADDDSVELEAVYG